MIIRSILFLLFIASYIYLVFIKGTGEATYHDYAVVFGLNFFIFIPMRVYQRLDGDITFKDIVRDGDSAHILQVLVSFIGLLAAIVLINVFANISSSNYLVTIGIILVGVVILIGLFARVLSSWIYINNIAVSAITEGNVIDKVGSVASYIGLITFSVLDMGCNKECSWIGIVISTTMMVVIYSPLIGSILLNLMSGLASSSRNMTAGDFSAIFHIVFLIMSIPTIHFSINIPDIDFHLLSILFSIPGVAFLTYILNTTYLNDKTNKVVTMVMVVLYYGTIFYQFK